MNKSLKILLIITAVILLLSVLVAGITIGVIWYNAKIKKPYTTDSNDQAMLNVACQELYMAIRTGLDDAEQNSEFADFLPEPSDTEEQRLQKAKNATIGDAIRYRSLDEDHYSEILKDMVIRDDGTLIPRNKITDETKIREENPTVDTTLGVLFDE